MDFLCGRTDGVGKVQEGVFVHVAQVILHLRIFSDGFGPLRFCLVGSGFDQREGCRGGFFVELSDEAEGISLIEIGIMAVSLGQCVDNRLNIFGCSVGDVFDELILQSLRQEQTTQIGPCFFATVDGLFGQGSLFMFFFCRKSALLDDLT